MHLLVVFTHVFKSRSRVQKFVNNKIKNNKSKKKRQTTKTNTHTNVFSCCCCCCCCGGKITCLVLFSHTSYHPFVFLKGSKEYKGREGEGEEVFWLFYLVDDLMDWSSCWNLLNADWPGWPDREKFDWRVVVTKKSQNQIEWSWWMDGWMDGWEKIPSVLDWTVEEPNALLLRRWIMSVGPGNKEKKKQIWNLAPKSFRKKQNVE